MRKTFFLTLFVLAVAGCSARPAAGITEDAPVTFSADDESFVSETLDDTSLTSLPLGERVLRIGRMFLGKPYVEKTLEVNAPAEQLVVNTQGVDCTTFVDQVLALSLASIEEGADFGTFCAQLRALRYHNGKVDGYASRCHYFLDLVHNASLAGKPLLVPVTDENVRTRDVAFSFMSTHPDAYVQLRESPAVVDSIRAAEQALGTLRMTYFPKEASAAFTQSSSPIRDGDILALVTTAKGLDVSHLGIAFWLDGKLHMLHASSTAHKVIADERTLADYLQGRKGCPGIVVYRVASR